MEYILVLMIIISFSIAFLVGKNQKKLIKRVISILAIAIFSVSTIYAADFKPGVRIKKKKYSEMRGVPMYHYYQNGEKIGHIKLEKELIKYRASYKNAELAHKYRMKKFNYCVPMLLFPLGTAIVVLGPHRDLDAKFYKYLDRAVNNYNRNPRTRKL